MRPFASLLLVPFLLSFVSIQAPTFPTVRSTRKPFLRVPLASPSTVRSLKTVTIPPLSGFECPAVPSGKLLLPSPPYDTEQGDCALIGRGDEIEAYLTALELTAQGCRDRVETAWQSVTDARTGLDSDIDSLPPPSPPEESDDSGSIYAIQESARLPMICSFPSPLEPSSEPIGGIPADGHYYTEWLKRIGENVERYCRMVDELMKPIADACEETREEAQCMVDDPAQGGVSDAMKTSFHSRVNGAMNAATLKHDYVLWYYENTLSTYGWGNFREYYNEEYVECSTPSQPGLTGIAPGTLLRNMGLQPVQTKIQRVPRGKLKTLPQTREKPGKKTTKEQKNQTKQSRATRRSLPRMGTIKARVGKLIQRFTPKTLR